MTDQKRINKDKKPRPKYNPNNKEQGSQKKKKRWKKHQKKPVDMNKKLQELQSYINGEYHSP